MKRLLESNPNSSLCHFNLGSVYARQKQFQEAATELNKLIDLTYQTMKRCYPRPRRGFV